VAENGEVNGRHKCRKIQTGLVGLSCILLHADLQPAPATDCSIALLLFAIPSPLADSTPQIITLQQSHRSKARQGRQSIMQRQMVVVPPPRHPSTRGPDRGLTVRSCQRTTRRRPRRCRCGGRTRRRSTGSAGCTSARRCSSSSLRKSG
jgi:hypothetical protein